VLDGLTVHVGRELARALEVGDHVDEFSDRTHVAQQRVVDRRGDDVERGRAEQDQRGARPQSLQIGRGEEGDREVVAVEPLGVQQRLPVQDRHVREGAQPGEVAVEGGGVRLDLHLAERGDRGAQFGELFAAVVAGELVLVAQRLVEHHDAQRLAGVFGVPVGGGAGPRGLEVVRPDLPLELIARRGPIGRTVLSFPSTVVHTLPLALSGTPVRVAVCASTRPD
jgi:hypothetical protein